MEKILLKLLDLFRWLFVLFKVDYDQVRSIVAIKLMMDNRRQIVVQRRKDGKEPGNAFVRTLLFYALFGIFFAWALYSIKAFMPSMIMFYSYIMVMIAMTLITDFSSVLMDTSDNTIILPRPVDGRTLFVARITHILLYLSQLAAGLSIAPLIVATSMYGVAFGILFIVGVIFSVITALFITNTVYLLLMQFANEEKLKSIINYFQIIMAVALMGGYQLLPRMLGRLDLENYAFEIHGWKYLIPPVWIAGALESFHFGLFDRPHMILTFLAFVVPVSGVYLVNKYLAPIFARKLGAIGGNSDQPAQRVKKEKGSFITRISSLVTRSAIEQGAFEAIFKILGRDRKIKLKVYPAYGYIIIFGLIFILRDNQDLLTAWNNLPETKYHILLIYLTFVVMQTALFEIPYSDDFKASWIYFSAPLDNPGEVLTGMLKAIMIRLFVPGYIAISFFIAFIWGPFALDDLLFGLFNNFLMLWIVAVINKRYLPLSMAPSTRNQSGNLLRSMLTFLMIGLLGGIHYLLSMKEGLLLAGIPVQLGVMYVIHRVYRKTSWDQITL